MRNKISILLHAPSKCPNLCGGALFECRRNTWKKPRPSTCFFILKLPLPPIPACPIRVVAEFIGRIPEPRREGKDLLLQLSRHKPSKVPTFPTLSTPTRGRALMGAPNRSLNEGRNASRWATLQFCRGAIAYNERSLYTKHHQLVVYRLCFTSHPFYANGPWEIKSSEYGKSGDFAFKSIWRIHTFSKQSTQTVRGTFA